MKRTFTINLNGIVFNIDDDAYTLLQSYLNDISTHLQKEESKEVLKDVEARIAELFTEKLGNTKNVVEIEIVKSIIDILGTPNQFSEEEGEQPEMPREEKMHWARRRFYRDPDHAVMGGVAAGLSAYFNIDVVFVRILLVIFLFLGFGSLIPVYLLVWLITPAAVSVSQKCEMQGEPITLKKIKNEAENAKKYVESDEFKKHSKEVGNRLLDVVQWIFKILCVIVGAWFIFVGIIVIIALIYAFMVLLLNPDMLAMQHYSIGFLAERSGLELSLFFSSLFLLVGIPVVSIAYSTYQVLNPNLSKPKHFGWVAFSFWLIGLLILVALVLKWVYWIGIF